MKGSKVYLVDDDESTLRSLSRLLRAAGFEVTSFSRPEEFLAHTGGAEDGCVIADLKMPGMNGFEMHDALQSAGSTLPFIYLTGFGDVAHSVRAMKKGAINFLEKPVVKNELLSAIEEAFQSLQAQKELKSELAELRSRFALLTAREREVCLMVAEGLLNKQTAALLGTAEKTIKVHRAQVMQKMKAESVADLVRMVDRLGVRKPQPANGPVH